MLDRAALASLRELQEPGEPDIVAEIGGIFLRHAPEKISALEGALARGDAMGLEAAAHSLKSSSSYVGAATLSAICRDLEEIGRSGRSDGAAEKAGELKAEYERVRAALEEEIQGANERRS